jgi:hypothetical protein
MFTRKIKFALAGVSGAAALAIGAAAPASAATGPAVYTTNSAGYVVTGANFEAVTTTVGARPVSQYNATANKTGFGHGVTLVSKQYTAALGISVFNGDNGTTPWDAAFALYNGSGNQVAGCLAGNNGGSGGVNCNASVTGEPGAFAAGPVKMTISYNPATNLLSFDAAQGSNDFSGTINLGVQFGTPTTFFKTAEIGTTVDPPSSQPAQPQLLGKFTGTSLTSYTGHTAGLSAHTTHQQFATSDGTSSGTVLLSPTALSNHGHVFQVFDDQG